MLVKQFSSFSRKHRTLSLQICVRQTGRLSVHYRICGLMQERVYMVQTMEVCIIASIIQTSMYKPPVRDTSRCDQRFDAAPH